MKMIGISMIVVLLGLIIAVIAAFFFSMIMIFLEWLWKKFK
jgi:hypothetical protein